MSLLVLMVSAGTFAKQAEVDGICYDLNSETKEATVIAKDDKSYKVVIIPSSVTFGSQTYSVTSIESMAFMNCSDLTSVTIPNSVTSIGQLAFWNCKSLTSITIPNSVTNLGESAFWQCKSLESVTLPNSLTSIEDGTFWGCDGLTSITIPESVTSIGAMAFCSCYNLTSITIPESVTSIGGRAFTGCGLTSITIPNSVTSVEEAPFAGCNNLTSISVEVGNPVYDSRENCNAIIETSSNTLISGCRNTVIPNSVTSIGKRAFNNCDLTSITIPESVTSIDEEAFYDCSGLTSITIPKSVTSIGVNAFKGCYGLRFISVEAGNSVYDSRENSNAIIETSSNTLICGCQNTVIPNSVTSIGKEAFSKCYNLTSITIPESVTSIGKEAFQGCSGLTSITIPESVTNIGELAFSNCTGLTSITILNSVTSIEERAFYPCYQLTSVTNLAIIPQEINAETFSVYGTLHVLPGCKAAYEAAENWRNFTIVEDAKAEPKAIAKAIMELINSIGKVEKTEACKTKIEAARAVYDALSKEHQALVKNYNKLVEAEDAYKKLSAQTDITNVNVDSTPKDAKYLENGKIVIIKNGKRFNINGL